MTLMKTTKNKRRAENALYRSGFDTRIMFVLENLTEENSRNAVISENAL